MNNITVNSRSWFNQLLNGDTFSANLSEYSTFFKGVFGEKLQLQTSVSVSTNLSANSSSEILFTTSAGTATWTHPYLNWSTEGFKVGDTIRVVRGVNDEDATIASISANVMTCNDPGFTAGLTIVSGTDYPDLEFRNTTLPTSLIFKFGIVPNITGGLSLSGANPYASWLDSSVTQAYSSGALIASPVALTGAQQPNTETTELVTCEYIATVANWIFTFEIVHTFTFIGYKDDYLVNLSAGTTPFQWAFPNSFRYVCQYLFGTNPTDPNEYRIFNDNLLNGVAGWVNQNFISGIGSYNLNAVSYAVGTSLEATTTNTITGSIKKTSGSWVAGDRVVLTHMKAATSSDYLGNVNTLYENFLFNQVVTTEGAVAVNSTIINAFTVDINGGDSTLLDYSFQIIFDSAEQAFITAGDKYLIGMQVGVDSGAASTSDRMFVEIDYNVFTKNADVPNLITDFSMNLYTSEKNIGGLGLKTDDVNTWNNRLHICSCSFNLKKTSGAGIGDFDETKITALKGQVVSRNSTTGESFVLSSFDMPFTPVIAEIASTSYQFINLSAYRDFNIAPTAHANNWGVRSSTVSSFDATHLWTVWFPFVIPWRTAQLNSAVPTSFYNSLFPNNNLNFKTSNYDKIGDWDIYVRILADVQTNGVVTAYGLYSTECTVKDFDVDPPTDNWTATIKLYNSLNQEVDYLLENEDTLIIARFDMSTAGSLSYSSLVGEFSIEELNSGGSNWRLNSSVNWTYPGNVLIPKPTELFVKVTQYIVDNYIILEAMVDYTKIDPASQYTIYAHLQDTT